MIPLTAKQKAAICAMASKAYKRHPEAYPGDSVDEYRRAVMIAAVGEYSLRECSDEDYIPIINTLRLILGLKPLPERERVEYAKARALYVLRNALQLHELTLPYLAAIARDKFSARLAGCDDIERAICTRLTSGQIMQLVYTINNRGRAKTRKLARLHGLDDKAR